MNLVVGRKYKARCGITFQCRSVSGEVYVCEHISERDYDNNNGIRSYQGRTFQYRKSGLWWGREDLRDWSLHLISEAAPIKIKYSHKLVDSL